MPKTTYAIDNSAILYLALMRERHTNIYRFTMTMKHEIDPGILQQAVDRIYRRFPTIIAGFRPGFFQYRVVPAEIPPQVLPDPGTLIPMSRREIETCAYRVYYRGRELIYEGFHAAADGYGAVASFTTLAAEYLRLRSSARIPVCSTLRQVDEAPSSAELEDSYLTHCTGKPLHLPSRYSYQLPGRYTSPSVYAMTRTYTTADLLTASRRHGVSLTSMLSAVMASAVMEIQQRHSKKLRPVRIMVPADLRRMFRSTTLRNFILYALPTMEPAERKLPLRDILHGFHNQIKEQLNPRRMASIMAYNVRGQANFFFRSIPWAFKRFFMRIAYHYFGESNSSITLTNLGSITLPPEMAAHVEHLSVTLTPRVSSPYNCGVIGMGDRLAITISRFCPHSELEDIFFTKMEEILA